MSAAMPATVTPNARELAAMLRSARGLQENSQTLSVLMASPRLARAVLVLFLVGATIASVHFSGGRTREVLRDSARDFAIFRHNAARRPSFSPAGERVRSLESPEEDGMRSLRALAASSVGVGSIMAGGIPGSALAQDAVQWRIEDGGNGHWYGIVRSEAIGNSWNAARSLAQSMGCELATFSASAEWVLVRDELTTQDAAGPVVGIMFLGGYRDGGEWKWVDGSSWLTPTPWWDGTSCGGGTPSPQGDGATLQTFCGGTTWDDRGPEGGGELDKMLVEWSADCNADGIVDYGQILDGTFADSDANGVPDICESVTVPTQYATIQSAIDAAADGCVIRVEPGVYAPFNMGDKRLVVESTQGMSVTTINAAGQPTSAVRFGPRSTFASTLRGFTIRTGSGTVFPNNPSGWRAGGGVYIWSNQAKFGGAAATIEDCVFIGATGGCGYGAGIWTREANIAVRRCRFSGLSAQHHGPAISLDPVPTHEVPGEPDMHSIVEDSFIGTSSSYNNGGMLFGVSSALAPTNVRLSRCEFAGNTASYQAGALLCGGSAASAGGEATVEDCVFRNNSAPQAKSIAIALLGGSPNYKVTLRGNVIADPAVSVRLGTGQLALESNNVCSGTSAIAGSFTDLGGNEWTCPDFVDCNLNGVDDLFDITLETSGDIDGNGVPDECVPPCERADIDESGTVNAVDLAALLSVWGTDGGKYPRADINADGIVSAPDLAEVLGAWGPCP